MIYFHLKTRFGPERGLIASLALYAIVAVLIVLCLDASPARFIYGDL